MQARKSKAYLVVEQKIVAQFQTMVTTGVVTRTGVSDADVSLSVADVSRDLRRTITAGGWG